MSSVLPIFLLLCLVVTVGCAKEPSYISFPPSIQVVLENTKSLEHPRGDRLPLLLWLVLQGVVEDDELQEAIIRELDHRGIAMIATWNCEDKETSLAKSLRIARIQQKLSLPVVVNANPCMYN